MMNIVQRNNRGELLIDLIKPEIREPLTKRGLKPGL